MFWFPTDTIMLCVGILLNIRALKYRKKFDIVCSVCQLIPVIIAHTYIYLTIAEGNIMKMMLWLIVLTVILYLYNTTAIIYGHKVVSFCCLVLYSIIIINTRYQERQAMWMGGGILSMGSFISVLMEFLAIVYAIIITCYNIYVITKKKQEE